MRRLSSRDFIPPPTLLGMDRPRFGPRGKRSGLGLCARQMASGCAPMPKNTLPGGSLPPDASGNVAQGAGGPRHPQITGGGASPAEGEWSSTTAAGRRGPVWHRRSIGFDQPPASGVEDDISGAALRWCCDRMLEVMGGIARIPMTVLGRNRSPVSAIFMICSTIGQILATG